ncbi:hypothetical protein AMJ86_09275, partial [bacterium SM23_57]
MNDTTIFNPKLDQKVDDVEQEFVQTAEQVLSATFNREVKVALLEILPFDFKTIKADFPQNTVYVKVGFHDGFEGNSLFLFSTETAAYLADLMMMGEGDAAFDSDEHLDAIQEMVNQIMAEYGRSLSSIFDRKVDFSESKALFIDLSPSDFQESNWVRIRLEIDAGQKLEFNRLVSWNAVHKYLPDSED